MKADSMAAWAATAARKPPRSHNRFMASSANQEYGVQGWRMEANERSSMRGCGQDWRAISAPTRRCQKQSGSRVSARMTFPAATRERRAKRRAKPRDGEGLGDGTSVITRLMSANRERLGRSYW